MDNQNKNIKKINKSFLLSLGGAAIMVLQLLGIRVNVPYVNQILEAVCALLIVLGVMTAPKSTEKSASLDNDIQKTDSDINAQQEEKKDSTDCV